MARKPSRLDRALRVAMPQGGGFNRPPKTAAEISAALAEIDAAIDRKQRSLSLQQEAAEISGSFRKFIRRAWPIIEPRVVYRHNWHIDAISHYLEAISAGEIRRLQVWIPPQSMKSRAVSVLWPTWEWTHSPHYRYYGGSYHLKLSKDLSGRARDLILSPWYQERWGDLFAMKKLDEGFYTNDKGGVRLATSPDTSGAGTGFHGHRILIDDAVNANDVTDGALQLANDWYSGPLATRGLPGYAEVIIMQRLSEKDLAAHAMSYGDWEILCLPEVYEREHPYAWHKDPRVEGELLWPNVITDAEHHMRISKLGRHRAAGQLQQRPAAREGEILKRANWNYYPPSFLDLAHEGDISKLPKFRRIVCSWDTSFKEKNTSDFVAGGIWGVSGPNKYLLRTFHERASLSRTKTLMLEARQWSQKRWPKLPLHIVIEKSANGIEIIEQLQREIPGVIPYPVTKDKTEKAEACEPDFDGRHVFLPGASNQTSEDYDPAVTPSWAQEVVEECATFPNGAHDDLVDMVTMGLIWIKSKGAGIARISSPASTIIDVRSRVTSGRALTLPRR